MTTYIVETLVHLNLDLTVNADDEDEAIVAAFEEGHRRYPGAVLVDPIGEPVESVDLGRAITGADRLNVLHESGVELSDDVRTLGDAIAALCLVGYGGHFDECLDDEHAAYHALGLDDAEREAIHAARNAYVARLRAAMEAVKP